MQASTLRLLILTLSTGASKVLSVFRDSPTKTFYAFYVSLIVVDFKGCTGMGEGDGATAPNGRAQGVGKWTANTV